MRLAQKKLMQTKNLDFVVDFLRSGLSYSNANEKLLYNFACANEQLGHYEKAMRFFQYAQIVRPNWTDAVFGEALTHFKLKNFKKAKKCVELALRTYEANSFESEDILRFMKAMCDKNLSNYEEATYEYRQLKRLFGRDEGGKVLSHTVSLVLLPLQNDRLAKQNFMENTL